MILKKIRKSGDQFFSAVDQRFGIDSRYFFSGGFWTVLAQGIAAILSLVVLIVLTHTLDQATVGAYKFFMSIFFTVSAFSLPGMHTAIIQSVADKHSQSFIHGMKYRICFSLIGSVTLLFTGAYFWYIDRWTPIYFLWGAILFPLYYSLYSTFAYLIGKERFRLSSIIGIAQLITLNLGLIVVIVLFKNIAALIIATLCLNVVTLAIATAYTYRKYQKEVKGKKDKKLFRYGFQLSIVQLIPIIAENLDKILLTFFLGPAQLAIYVIAMSFPSQNKLFLAPLANLTLPKMTKYKKSSALVQNLKRKTPLLILLSLGINLLGFLLTPLAVKYLFPTSYIEAVPYAQIAFSIFIFSYAAHVYKSYLVAQKRIKQLYTLDISQGAVKIIGLLLLTPFFGLLGAIVATMISRYFYFLLGFRFLSAKT
jgi:O-antigen/teichoic acid export membrane protein